MSIGRCYVYLLSDKNLGIPISLGNITPTKNRGGRIPRDLGDTIFIQRYELVDANIAIGNFTQGYQKQWVKFTVTPKTEDKLETCLVTDIAFYSIIYSTEFVHVYCIYILS